MTAQPTPSTTRRHALRLACRAGAALLATAAAALPAAAADAYPTKPITLVVPFPPGGGTDIVARQLAAKLQPLLGQPLVIENKPGASTAIGAAAVAKAPADGYTLLLSGSSTFSIVPALKPGLPYDPLASFVPVAVVARSPLALYVGPGAQATTLPALQARLKAQPDGEMFATFGNGSGPHLAGAMFAEAVHAKLTAVPYKGAAPAMTAVIGGEVALGFDTLAAVTPQAKAGKVRALAVTGDRRSPLLPEVPTYAELGLAPASLVTWYALVAPARTPAPVVARLAQALQQAMADPALKQSFQASGLDPVFEDGAAYQALVQRELAQFRALAERARITMD